MPSAASDMTKLQTRQQEPLLSETSETISVQMSRHSSQLQRDNTGSREHSHRDNSLKKDSTDTPETGMVSTRATSSVANESSIIRPLLKVSPPTPYGTQPGRYKVTLRRATVSQPFGVCFEQMPEARTVLIGEDEERVGLRKGDQVLKINNRVVRDVEDARMILAGALNVELTLQHHEQGFTPSIGCDMVEQIGCESGSCRLPCCGERQTHQPRHSMRQLLSTSGPVLTGGPEGNNFAVQIVRASLVQPYGLIFEDGTDEALYIKEDFPQYGLQAGDRVLQINNQCDLKRADAEALLEPTMNVWIECRREDLSANAICEALPLEDINEELARKGVCIDNAFCCDGIAKETKMPASRNSSNFGGIFAMFCSAQDVKSEEITQTISTEDMPPRVQKKLSF